MFHLVLMLAASAPIAAADTGGKYTPEAAAAAEQRLAVAGEVLGAASQCKEVDAARLKAAMRKVEAMIDKGVDDNRQYYAARNILSKGVDKGRKAIRDRETD